MSSELPPRRAFKLGKLKISSLNYIIVFATKVLSYSLAPPGFALEPNEVDVRFAASANEAAPFSPALSL